MNMKRILVLVMTFAMLVSTFAPTLGVFADYVAGNGDNGKDGTLDYVSLGDSMTNGIGMDGYDQTDNPGTDNDGRNGYLEVAGKAYPALFAEWLKGYTGKDVNLTQLATSGARVEDVLYILNHGTENAFEADPWTKGELLENSDRWGDPTNKNDAPFNNDVAETHREAVKNADVISLATGNGNFGVFMMGRIMNLIGLGSPDDLADDIENYGYYTVENAVALCGGNEEITKLVMDAYNNAIEYLAGIGVPAELVKSFADLMAYTTASYVVSTIKLIDLIVEMNPDVTLIIVPLINNGEGFVVDFSMNGKTNRIDMGSILGALYTPLNAFLAAYPTAKQVAGEFANAKFLYAELPTNENGETVNVETYAQAFDEYLYADFDAEDLGNELTWTKNEKYEDIISGYPESRRFCHGRFMHDVLGFALPILKPDVAPSYDSNNTEQNAQYLKDIMEYEAYKALGPVAFAEYAAAKDSDTITWVCAYLGVVEATLNSFEEVSNVDMNEMEIPAGGEVNVFTILTPAVAKVIAKLGDDTTAETNPVFDEDGKLVYNTYAYIVESVFLPQMAAFGVSDLETAIALLDDPSLAGPYASALEGQKGAAQLLATAWASPELLTGALESEGLVQALLNLFGRLKLAWGLSAHPSEAGHDTLTQSLINAYENEYTTKDETIENVKETIILAIKVTDKAYQEAYDYVDEAGYINKVVSIVNRVINRLKLVDLSDNGPMTEEFRALLEVEVDATIATLEEIKDVLANDKADDLRGLLATLYALLDDVVTHLNNIYALCAQAGIDVNQLVIIPALKEALVIIETELIPALNELVEEFVEAVIAHVTEKAEELYNYALGLSKEVYLQLVALVVRVQLHVEEKVEEIVDALLNQYFALVEKLEKVYGNVEDAVNTALKVIGAVADKIIEVAGSVENALEIAKNVLTTAYDVLVEAGLTVKAAFEIAVDVYTAVVEFLVENAESVEKALEIAGKAFEYVLEVAAFVYENAEEIYAIATKVYATLVDVIAKVYNIVETTIDVYNFVYDLLVNVFGSVENAICIAGKVCKLVVEFIKNTPELLENAYQLYCDIYDLIVEVYGKTADAEECAKAVYTYVVGVLTVAIDDIKEAIYNASNGDYTITENSFYVALGNAEYAEELAGMLYLEGKLAQYGLADDYTADLSKADLVTVKFNNGEFFAFAYTQVIGMVATIVRESDFYANYSEMIDGAVAEFGIDMNAEAAELDWSKYLDAETSAIFQARLDKIGADLVAAGIPAVYELDLAPVLAEYGISSENGLIVEIPVAELVAFAIENAVYAYAETAARVANTLGNIYTVAPNATVVITGINNPLALYAEALESLVPGAGEYVEVLDDVVEFLNIPLYACAVANKNTIFVNSDNAEDIYAALHAHCAHAYDNACDTTCNICGETREVAPHVYDDCADATCNICGAERVAPGHSFTNYVFNNDAACEKNGTETAKCDNCDATHTREAEGTALDHVYDDEYDPDCNVCGALRNVPSPDKDGLPVWAIVAIAVGSVAVACGAGAAIYWFFIKKKNA